MRHVRTACTFVAGDTLFTNTNHDLPRAQEDKSKLKTQFIIVIIFRGGILARP